MNWWHVATLALYLAAAIVVAFGLWALCVFVIVGLG